INGCNGVFSGIEQRFYKVEILGKIVVIILEMKDMLHHIEMLYGECAVSVYQIAGVNRVRDGFAEMPVIAAASKHIVNIVIHVAAILKPSAFVDVETGCIVKALVGLFCPAYVIQKLGDDITSIAQVS